MNKKILLLLLLSVTILGAVDDTPGQDEPRMLALGKPASGRLDNRDHTEEEYAVELSLDRGVYRLKVVSSKGEPPDFYFSSASLKEDVSVQPSLSGEAEFELTLPAGLYTVTVDNASNSPAVSYEFVLELIGPWQESREWEPNDELPNQEVRPGASLSGSLQGLDEDVFLFKVPVDHSPAYDFLVRTSGDPSLFLKVSPWEEEEKEEESELACVGIRTGNGFLIRGLALEPGVFSVTLSRSPGDIMAAVEPSGTQKKKWPRISYILEVSPNSRPFQDLVPIDQAMGATFRLEEATKDKVTLREQTSPRMEMETELYNLGAEHQKALGSRIPSFKITPAHPKVKIPGQEERVQAFIISLAEEMLRVYLRPLLDDPQLRTHCLSWAKRLGMMNEFQAKAFGNLWPAWSTVPNEWAAAVLDSPAAHALQKAVFSSAWIVSARVLLPSGILAAATEIPRSLWQGEAQVLTLWHDRKREIASGPLVFDESLKRWTLETAFPIQAENGQLCGVLIIKTAVSR